VVRARHQPQFLRRTGGGKKLARHERGHQRIEIAADNEHGTRSDRPDDVLGRPMPIGSMLDLAVRTQGQIAGHLGQKPPLGGSEPVVLDDSLGDDTSASARNR